MMAAEGWNPSRRSMNGTPTVNGILSPPYTWFRSINSAG